jgi:hypothetical protein
MKGAVGFSYRENEYEFESDNINNYTGKSLNDQVLGLYPAGEFQWDTYKVKGRIRELLVPILKDIPFIKNLDLSLGAPSFRL